MDADGFQQIVEQVLREEKRAGGIGTLGERTLHTALKRYVEPLEINHEVKVGPYVADIVGEEGIVEIQTRSLNRLRDKLAAFLEVADVTVVYPLERYKWLIWIDPETGEARPRRKSPKNGSFYHAFKELYRIKPLLTHPRLKIRLMLMDMEEHRYLNGWSRDGKRGSTRWERIPIRLVDELTVGGENGFRQLIPQELGPSFTSRDFAAAAKISQRHAQTALNVLYGAGAVERTGKEGRLFTYTHLHA